MQISKGQNKKTSKLGCMTVTMAKVQHKELYLTLPQLLMAKKVIDGAFVIFNPSFITQNDIKNHYPFKIKCILVKLFYLYLHFTLQLFILLIYFIHSHFEKSQRKEVLL